MLAAVEPSSLYQSHRANYQGTKRPGKVPDGRTVTPRLIHENPTDDIPGLGRRKIPATKQKPTRGTNVCIVYPRVVHRELVDNTPVTMYDGDVLFVGKRQTIFGAGQNRISRTMTWRHLNTELMRPENMLNTADPTLLDRVIDARQAWIDDVSKRLRDDVDTLQYLTDRSTLQNVHDDFMNDYRKTLESLDCANDVLQIASRARNLGEAYEIDPWFDWRVVPALQHWTVDGVLHNSEFAKELINEVYPSSTDDEMLLNVAMQGPCHVRNSKHEKHSQFFDDAAAPGDMLLMCIISRPVAPGVWIYQIKPASSRQLCFLMQDRGVSLGDDASCAPGGQQASFSKFDLLFTVGAWKIGTVIDDRMVTGTHGKMNVAVSIEFLSVDKMWYTVGNQDIPIVCLTRQRHLKRLRDHARGIRDRAELRRFLALEEALRRMVVRRREQEAQRMVQQQLDDAAEAARLALLAVLAEEAAERARQIQRRVLEDRAREEGARRADAEMRRRADAAPGPARPLALPAPNDWTAMTLYARPVLDERAETVEYNIGAALDRLVREQARTGDYFDVGSTFLGLETFTTTAWNVPFQNRVSRIRGRFGSDGRPLLQSFADRTALTLNVATRSYVTYIARTGLAMTGLEQNMYANAIRMLEMTNIPTLIQNAVVLELDPGTREGGCAAYGGLNDGNVTVTLCNYLEQQGYQVAENANLLRFERPAIRDVNGEDRIVVDNVDFEDILAQGDDFYVQLERINAALVLLFNVPHDNALPWQTFDGGKTWSRSAVDLYKWDTYDSMVDRVIGNFNSLSIINGLSRAINHCIIAMAVLGSCNLNGVPDRLVNRLRVDVQGGPGSLIQWEGGQAPSRIMTLDGSAMTPQNAQAMINATDDFDTPFGQLTASWDVLSTSFDGLTDADGAVATSGLLPLPTAAPIQPPFRPMILPEFAFADAVVASAQAEYAFPSIPRLYRFGLSPSRGISYPLPPPTDDLAPGNTSGQLALPVRTSWTSNVYNSIAAYYPEGGISGSVRGMVHTLIVMAMLPPVEPEDRLGVFQRVVREAT